MKRKFLPLLLLSLLIGTSLAPPASAYTFDQNRIIDDSVFNNFGSMNAGQIDAFLNGFPNSCISPNSGFRAVDPTGYNPTNGYQYGGFVTAGQVIYDAAQAYSLNPQVLLTTLEKEQSLVTGRNNFAGYCNDGDQHKYAAAVGYGCPDSLIKYSWTGLNLYQRNGVTVTSTGTTCVNTAAKAGFSQQVIRAAWLLKFGQQRSRGNVGWAVIKGSWDNSDDPQTCYGGPTTQGTFAVCPSAAATYHDGYFTIDSTAVHMESGATAALYWYTPHFHGNQNFYSLYTGWFGSTKEISLPGCIEAYNTARACVWYMSGPSGQPYYTSLPDVRQDVVGRLDYRYQSRPFFGNAIQLAGNIPVYRLEVPGDGGSFLTAGLAEYNALIAAGWTGKGIDFYADPGNTNSGYPVYRLYSPTTGDHRWLTNMEEVNNLLRGGYVSEGVAFTSISAVRQETAAPAGKMLVYRFYVPATVSHFWTTDVYERDTLINAGYPYEGVAWQTYTSAANNTPVYRLYAPSLKQHLYTTGTNERDVLVRSGGWVDEGISQYVSSVPTSKPVYRLYAPSLATHHLTLDAYERSVLIQSRGWVDEGIAWYQP